MSIYSVTMRRPQPMPRLGFSCRCSPGWQSPGCCILVRSPYMGSESLQHKLDRVRRPRVLITYDVETGGAMRQIELPFVVGVLADLSGNPKEALKPLKERKAITIDRDNFNEVLA